MKIFSILNLIVKIKPAFWKA